ncbi:MAG: PfkB family carbohydrate kinase, partial [Litorimonas sp.]
ASRIRARIAVEPVAAQLIEMEDQPSDTSIVLTDGQGSNVIVTTVDCARSLSFESIRAHMAQAVTGDVVVLQGNLSLSSTSQIIDFAHSRGMIVALNPSPFEPGIEDLLPKLDILFLNEHEARLITATEEVAAVRALLDMRIGSVVLTLGDRGALLGDRKGIVAVPAQPCDVTDTTGAGDTLQSVAIASSLRRKVALDVAALNIAARAAALTVSRAGTANAFPTEGELSDLLGSAAFHGETDNEVDTRVCSRS